MAHTVSGHSAKRRNSRNIQGSFIELGAALIVIIPIILCLFDIAILITTAVMSDSLCRNAARIASSGEPSDVHSRVQAALDQAKVQNPIVSNLRLAAGYPVNDNNVSLVQTGVTGPVNGTVTVKIAVDVHPPFLISHVLPNQVITMNAQQTFPYTFIRKNANEDPN
jgi:hypothetical protein